MTMSVCTITKAGQVTIPKEIRDILGVGIHDQIAFLSDGKRVEIIAVPENPLLFRSMDELWGNTAKAEKDIAGGRTRPAGEVVAESREKYGL